jgi:hypothetical protein
VILSIFLPDRFSFFEKCLNTLFGIIGRAQSSERLVHVRELLCIVHVFGVVEGAFGDLDRYGAFFRQFLCPMAGLHFQLFLGHQFIDQTKGERFGGCSQVAVEQQFERFLSADAPGHWDDRPDTIEAQVDGCKPHTGVIGSDDQIRRGNEPHAV